MARKANQQDRLDALTDICLALPETTREDKESHAAFLVRQEDVRLLPQQSSRRQHHQRLL